MFISYRNNVGKQRYNKTHLAEAYLEPNIYDGAFLETATGF